jgi:hypothetical protein
MPKLIVLTPNRRTLQISLLSNDFLNKNLEVTVATFVTQMSIKKSSHVTSEMHMF